MFGRESEQEKAGKAAELLSARAVEHEADRKRAVSKEKEKREAPKREAENKRITIEVEAKIKADYISEKSKLTEKELFAEILWRLSQEDRYDNGLLERIQADIRDGQRYMMDDLQKIRKILTKIEEHGFR